MTITFHSDSSYVDQGFTAEFETFVPTNRKTWSSFLLVHPTVFSSILSRCFVFGVWLFVAVVQRVPDGSSAPTTCASTRRCTVTAGTTVETAATRTTAVSPTHELWTKQNHVWRDVLWLWLMIINIVDELLSSLNNTLFGRENARKGGKVQIFNKILSFISLQNCSDKWIDHQNNLLIWKFRAYE